MSQSVSFWWKKDVGMYTSKAWENSSKQNTQSSNVENKVLIGSMQPNKYWAIAWDPHLPWFEQETTLWNATIRSRKNFRTWGCVICRERNSMDFWESFNIWFMVIISLLPNAFAKGSESEITWSMILPPVGSINSLLEIRNGFNVAMAVAVEMESQ